MLVAIIPYYNPCKWKKRLKNYNICVNSLKKQCKVITIECSQQKFDTDADVKVHSPDILWQKECLINTALNYLPSCDNIAWIDGDMVFTDDDWVEKTEELLKSYDYVQLFDEITYLNEDMKSYGAIFANIKDSKNSPHLRQAPGGAWATRLNIFPPKGLYYKHVLGGGDAFFWYALFGHYLLLEGTLGPYWESIVGFLPELKQDMLAWSNDYYKFRPNPTVTYLPQNINHLFHGQFKNRQYLERLNILRTYNYNPHTDVKLENGTLRWSNDKKEFRDLVKWYFYERNEDYVSKLWV